MAMQEGGSHNLELLLGKRVQSYRRTAGLTQQQLCNKANISYSTLTKIERGAIKSPSVFTVDAIASAMGTSLDELIGNGRGNSVGGANNKQGIRFVYFDVHGCLIRFTQLAYSKIAETYQIPVERVESAYWHYNDAACKGNLSIAEFNSKFGDRLGVKNLKWQDYYLEAVQPIPESVKLLKWADEHYRVGLITNIMPGLLDGLRKLNKVPDIPYRAIVDSSVVRLLKPDPKMLKLAEECAGVSPEQILLIDDNPSAIVNAEKAGWHVVWFDYANPEESVKRVMEILELS